MTAIATPLETPERAFPRLALIALGVSLSLVAPVHAARPDRSVNAGARALPDTSFVANARNECSHYVAPNGNDSAVGSASQPWRTVGKALRTLRAGQVGCVASGTYVENAAQPAFSGTHAAPIVLKRQPGSATRPVIRPNGAVAVFHMDQDYWIVDGFDVDVAGQRVTGFRWYNNADFGVLRNSVLHGSSAGANVYVSGRDFLLEDSEIHTNFRTDNEDSHGIIVPESSPAPARILIRRNVIHDNGGDGFQCEGYSSPDAATTPRDITLEDNHYYTSPANFGRVEQAVDIKSCRQVTIRGSIPPDADRPGVAANYMHGFREKAGTVAKAGSAMVVHYNARDVLIENTRISDSCNALGVGRGGDSSTLTTNVVFRRNVVHDLFKNTPSGSRCLGYGISLNRVDNVDVYHNTFDRIPATAFYATNYNPGGTPNRNIDFWNNIVRDASPWISVPTSASVLQGFVSDKNLYWNRSGQQAGIRVNGAAKTLAQWRTYSNSAHTLVADPAGLVQDPLFVDAPAEHDYQLQANSPARNIALNNTGATFSDAGPDIGFRERHAAIHSCRPLSIVASASEGENVPANVVDGNLATRWSAPGEGSWITFDYGSVRTMSAAHVAWHQGNLRRNRFVVSVSTDGLAYQPVFSGTSSGTTTAIENYAFAGTQGRFLRLTVNGNTLNSWASVTELSATSACTRDGEQN
ncbi:discoidin domain-containing protein [Tahibacter amnicola]|uniref:Discoidin domain-containing protein n=1 Tax=Tahibacter amnicola TaxID=2976241 RepID=A0ABY6BLG2_9GAMM|nr:discoidin domain-containing protein [Tahibacter amnicola]UXI70273.1 discoidin domain-containing protein [Tahibacter amnicola]